MYHPDSLMHTLINQPAVLDSYFHYFIFLRQLLATRVVERQGRALCRILHTVMNNFIFDIAYFTHKVMHLVSSSKDTILKNECLIFVKKCVVRIIAEGNQSC